MLCQHSKCSLGGSKPAKSTSREKTGARLCKKLMESGVVGQPLSPSFFAFVPIFARQDFARSIQRNAMQDSLLFDCLKTCIYLSLTKFEGSTVS